MEWFSPFNSFLGNGGSHPEKPTIVGVSCIKCRGYGDLSTSGSATWEDVNLMDETKKYQYVINGDFNKLYDLLSNSDFFTSVNKTEEEGIIEIACSDADKVRLSIKQKEINGTYQYAYTYYYEGGYFYCFTDDGTSKTDGFASGHIPYVIYIFSSTIVILHQQYRGMVSWPMSAIILTKDNKNKIGIITGDSAVKSFWEGGRYVHILSTNVYSSFRLNCSITTIGSATTLTPFTTTDLEEPIYFPKVFRGITSQFKSDNVGEVLLNDKKYFSLYGSIYIDMD